MAVAIYSKWSDSIEPEQSAFGGHAGSGGAVTVVPYGPLSDTRTPDAPSQPSPYSEGYPAMASSTAEYWGGNWTNAHATPPVQRTLYRGTGVPSYSDVAFSDRLYGLESPQNKYNLDNNNKVYNLGSNDPRSASINSFFNAWTGPVGSFVNYKADMGGQVTQLSREEKALSYAVNYPQLYQEYVSGGLSDQQLFRSAMTDSVKFDANRLGFGTTPAGTAISFSSLGSSNGGDGSSFINMNSNYGGIFNFKSFTGNWNTSGKSVGGSIYKGFNGAFSSGLFR